MKRAGYYFCQFPMIKLLITSDDEKGHCSDISYGNIDSNLHLFSDWLIEFGKTLEVIYISIPLCT